MNRVNMAGTIQRGGVTHIPFDLDNGSVDLERSPGIWKVLHAF